MILYYVILYYMFIRSQAVISPDRVRKSAADRLRHRTGLTDGIGTPNPNPRHLVNWCF